MKKKFKYKKTPKTKLEELRIWESHQLSLAQRHLLRLAKQAHMPPIQALKLYLESQSHPPIQSIPQRYSIQRSPIEKLFHIDHLKDLNGKLQYWGKLPASLRPKPVLKNGQRSPEDLILNPSNSDKPFLDSQRERANAKLMRKLMLAFGIDEPRVIRIDEPGKIDTFIQDSNIRLPQSVDPKEATRKRNWMLTGHNKCKRFFTRSEALSSIKRPGRYHLLCEDPPDGYWYIRYRVRVKRIGGKLIKKIKVIERVKL